MIKITSASKKMLSLLLAVLMLCSGIAVSASAEEATTVEVNQITLGADNCKFINDEYGKKIVVNNAKIEPSVKDSKPGDYLQFIRSGYFTPDYDSTPEHLVFNRTVTLKDSWAKQKAKMGL